LAETTAALADLRALFRLATVATLFILRFPQGLLG